MDKQSTAAFILIGVILVVWLFFNTPEPKPPVKNAKDTTLVKKDTATVPAEEVVKEIPKKEIKPDENDPYSPTLIPENIITVETDLIKMELTSKGARIRKYYLKNYETWYAANIEDTTDFYNRHVQLINPKDGGDFNLIFVTKSGKKVNTKSLDFKTTLNNYYYNIGANDSLLIPYEFKTVEGKSITKEFIIYGNNYASKVNIVLQNMNDYISSYRYDLDWSNGINFVEKNSVDEAAIANASAYAGDEQVIVDASSAEEPVTKDLNGKIDWIGIRNKYFAVIISPNMPSDDGGAYFEGKHVVTNKVDIREYYSASLKIPFDDTQYQKNSFQIYIGPIEYNTLKSYGKKYESIFDFGNFLGLKIIIRPISEYILLPLFKFLHLFIPNYGFVIIIFSLLIKFALYPLTKSSLKSMKKVQMLQPKITELKEKFKDDPQKVQKETMKLYSTYGVNPAGGCLPMLLQMPILVALWSLLNVAIDIRQQPFMLWIDNLSSPDVIFKLPMKIPLFGIDIVSGLALLLGITMFIQQKMSMKDPSQKAMVYIMPVMFTLMFMGLPSGLNLYYFMFNLFSILQQYYVNHKTGNVELVPVSDPKKAKGGFMTRMMEAAEKQAQAQKKAGQKRK